MKTKSIVKLVAAFIGLIIVLIVGSQMITTVDAGEIVVRQGLLDGKLTVWTEPGPKFQNFGDVTVYKKAFEYSFSSAKDQGDSTDQSVRVRFNDGGHGNVSGTFRATLPTSPDKMRALHSKYRSMTAIKHELLRPALERSVYMSGPFMSSKESSSERRAELFNLVEDQLTKGICRVESHEKKVVDTMSGKDRTIKYVVAVKDKTGGCFRQEHSPLDTYRITVDSFNINQVKYDEDVENQIKGQQKLEMDVQTSIARAKRAEQDALTEEKQGQANAAKAKWEEEVKKAKRVTQAQADKEVAELDAEKKKQVAQLNKEAAEYKKQELVLLGEGEASKARAVMQANGYLPEKLAAWERVNKAYAEQLGKQPQVPSVVVGSDGKGGSMRDVMELLKLRSMQDVGINLGRLNK